jgi:hypothetical protein
MEYFRSFKPVETITSYSIEGALKTSSHNRLLVLYIRLIATRPFPHPGYLRYLERGLHKDVVKVLFE